MLKFLLILVPSLLVAYFVALAVLPWEKRRKLRHFATYAMGYIGAVVALIPLLLLIWHLAKEGLPGINADFFFKGEKPTGMPGGGYANAIVGSGIIVLLAALVGVPIGILAGIYLAEVGKGWFAATIRFLAEVLTGLPSIIAGILVYLLVVMNLKDVEGWKNFNAVAGAIALALLMIPVITRVTEEAIRMVPGGLREASYGLGVPQWRTVLHVVLPAARSGILTGVVLAIARVGGETAPLLFTTLGNREIIWDPRQSMGALPLSIYNGAKSPSDINIELAVSGALFLVFWVALVNVIIRWLAIKFQPKTSA